MFFVLVFWVLFVVFFILKGLGKVLILLDFLLLVVLFFVDIVVLFVVVDGFCGVEFIISGGILCFYVVG